jgi:hypothetical protein
MRSMKRLSFRKTTLLLLVLVLLTGIIGMAVVSRWPGVGAQVARPLRQVIGNRGVALLETVLFQTQDGVRRVQYGFGLKEAAAPWEVVAEPTAVPLPPTPTLSPTPEPTATGTAVLVADSAPIVVETPAPTETPPPTPTPTPTPSPTPVVWSLPAAPAFGDLAGEGEWQPYLTNANGDVVALRTFLQPDPERPYAIVAVVAFDLSQVDLHYALGTKEPALADGPRGSGLIPAELRQAERLLAAFNGGFMASHGEYGAMADGLIALPAKNGYATVAMYPDGAVRIGNWNETIDPAGPFTSWRQNARLVVADGVVNERVYTGSIVVWGGNINGNIVTWRSGLGINEDNDVLYFLAGSSMSMPTLAEAMTAVGVHNGLLLDINESWVHFAAVRPDGAGDLLAEPLFPEGMATWPDRYLRQSDRDFFYVTVKGE